MTESSSLDEVRRTALDRIEQSRRRLYLAFGIASVWEALFLVALLLTVDFHQKLHLLIFISTVGSYSLLVMAMVILGVYINRGNLRLLQAIELLREERNGR